MARAPIEPIALSLVDDDLAEAAFRFGDSFERTGFALASAHGVPAATVEATLSAMRTFFALPEVEKRRLHQPGSGGARGFTPFGIETAKGAMHHDLKEFLHVGREIPDTHPLRSFMPPNVWPDYPAALRPAALALFNALEAAGARILRAVAVYLGLPADFFAEPVCDGNSVLRLLHYPPVTVDAPNLRAGAHEDINVITLLLGAEEAGLQLLARNGEWLDVTPPEGSIVVNVGDMLERLSGGRLRSTTHRVVNPIAARRDVPRYSTPFFLHFRPDYVIRPLGGDEERWPPISAHDFLNQRLREIRLL